MRSISLPLTFTGYDTQAYRTAQRNFVESMAGYSILSYLFQARQPAFLSRFPASLQSVRSSRTVTMGTCCLTTKATSFTSTLASCCRIRLVASASRQPRSSSHESCWRRVSAVHLVRSALLVVCAHSWPSLARSWIPMPRAVRAMLSTTSRCGSPPNQESRSVPDTCFLAHRFSASRGF